MSSVSLNAPDDMPEEIVRFHRLRLELDAQSDRSVAILGGAYAELAIENAIRARLTDKQLKRDATLFDRLFTGYGPIAAFSAKMDVAYGLNLLGEHTYGDAQIIRGIRNDFAHNLDAGDPSLGLDFTTPSVASRCGNLWFPKNDYYARNSKELQEQARLDIPRGMFVFSVFQLAHLARVAGDRARQGLDISVFIR